MLDPGTGGDQQAVRRIRTSSFCNPYRIAARDRGRKAGIRFTGNGRKAEVAVQPLVAVLVGGSQNAKLGGKLDRVVGDVVIQCAGNERIAAVGGCEGVEVNAGLGVDAGTDLQTLVFAKPDALAEGSVWFDAQG